MGAEVSLESRAGQRERAFLDQRASAMGEHMSKRINGCSRSRLAAECRLGELNAERQSILLALSALEQRDQEGPRAKRIVEDWWTWPTGARPKTQATGRRS